MDIDNLLPPVVLGRSAQPCTDMPQRSNFVYIFTGRHDVDVIKIYISYGALVLTDE